MIHLSVHCCIKYLTASIAKWKMRSSAKVCRTSSPTRQLGEHWGGLEIPLNCYWQLKFIFLDIVHVARVTTKRKQKGKLAARVRSQGLSYSFCQRWCLKITPPSSAQPKNGVVKPPPRKHRTAENHSTSATESK